MRDTLTTPMAIIEADLEALQQAMSLSPVFQTTHEPDALLYWSHLPLPAGNVITHARISARDVPTRVPALLGPYLERGLPFRWVTTPKTTTPALEAALAQAGMVPRESPAMYLALQETVDPGTPDDVYIDVAWPDHLEPVSSILFSGFGLPRGTEAEHLQFLDTLDPADTQFFIARSLVTGEPLGASTMHRRGTSVMLANVSTSEHARGRGIAKALCATMLNRAAHTEALTATVLSNDEGYQVYVDLGFRTKFNVVTWEWHPQT
ncbi:GNAT family N-acetyltransferase [Nocardioides houyundeii]|uniref:GNAT family N-acetyltransferase n=1 Tax=Nocardioides houyundeii TaxID=2045452 RepID=UPI000C784732|nr:GNAT family N-acetyltransferase [Nocardioides houyundeii]